MKYALRDEEDRSGGRGRYSIFRCTPGLKIGALGKTAEPRSHVYYIRKSQLSRTPELLSPCGLCSDVILLCSPHTLLLTSSSSRVSALHIVCPACSIRRDEFDYQQSLTDGDLETAKRCAAVIPVALEFQFEE
jgi:hypothetical protein